MAIKHLRYYTRWGAGPTDDMVYCANFNGISTASLCGPNSNIYIVNDLEITSCLQCILFHNALKYGTSLKEVEAKITKYQL